MSRPADLPCEPPHLFCHSLGPAILSPSYRESDHQVDVNEGASIASYTFDMVYERTDARWLAKGHDLFVLERTEGRWLAVWRTMTDVSETPAPTP